jgi:2-hydroxychromene-2-carboxylate isomerase
VSGSDIRRLRGLDPFAGEPVSGQYNWVYRERDARRWADYCGIPFREPPRHDLDFQLLARAATAAAHLGRAAEYGWRLCATVYGSGVWPVDERACVHIAEELGLAAADFRAVLHAASTARTLASTAEEACHRGAFGVPTFFYGSEMFWGNDRLVILEHFLQKQSG